MICSEPPPAYPISAGSAWTARFLTIPPSRRTVTAAFGRATSCGTSSRPWWTLPGAKAWWAATVCGGRQPHRCRCQQTALRSRSTSGDADDPGAGAGRAVREYLATLDDAAFGAASEVTPKFISPSDPAAQWTGAHKGHAFFAYATNYLIDTDHGVILDVEATRAIRQAEVGAARTMIDRTEDRFGLKPEYLAADSAYGSAANLAWLVKEREIAPHIPVFDKSNRTDGTFSRADFMFDPDANEYTCPGGKSLVQFRRSYKTPRTGITSAGTRLYRASQHDCKVCELKPQCCPNMTFRKIPRDLNEDARDVARAIAETPEYERSRHRRKKVEMLFAHLKRILRLGRLRLRGPSGARDEFLLAATAQNLRRLAKLRSPAGPMTAAMA